MSKLLQSMYRLKELRAQPMWKLLASDDSQSVMAILKMLLGSGDRSLGSSAMHERVARCLEELKSSGDDLKQGAREYIAQWVKNGWLNRRIVGAELEETYELSAAAHAALRFGDEISAPRNTATESRLALVIQQATQLAHETNPNITDRLDVLRKRRDELNVQIQDVMAGKVVTLSNDRASERLYELVSLAREIGGDFSRLKEEFQQVDRAFRRQLIEGGQSRHDILEMVFSRMEVLAETEAGRTFLAFWRLLTDPLQAGMMEDAIEDILKREFAANLTKEEKRFLLRLSEGLMNEAREVHGTIHGLSRSLKTFVQSREFKEHQRIRNLIGDAQKSALQVNQDATLRAKMEFEITVPAADLDSISRLSLHWPSDVMPAIEMINAGESEISMGEITAQIMGAEIDLVSLITNIRDALSKQDDVSISELSQRYPMDQGVGSLLGYMHLATKAGFETPGKNGKVIWTDQAGITKTASITATYFTKDHLHALS